MYRDLPVSHFAKTTQLVEVLDLGIQALASVFPKARTQQITAGPRKLLKYVREPDACGLLQLKHTYELSELYDENYAYRGGLKHGRASAREGSQDS